MKCNLTTIVFGMPSARPREEHRLRHLQRTQRYSPGGGEDGPNKVGWSITQNATAANA